MSTILNNMSLDNRFFNDQIHNQEKVGKAKRSLDKTVSDDNTANKLTAGNDGKPVNAQQAFILAMAQMMSSNLDTMDSHATTMSALQSPMNDVQNQLKDLDKEQGDLSSLSPEDAMVKAAEINSEYNTVNTRVSTLGMSGQQESMQISYLASQNDATAGAASKTLDLIAQADRTRR
jgi:Cu/Ag efflux protein CusF